jgi:hypothetical protein
MDQFKAPYSGPVRDYGDADSDYSFDSGTDSNLDLIDRKNRAHTKDRNLVYNTSVTPMERFLATDNPHLFKKPLKMMCLFLVFWATILSFTN